MKLLTIDFGGTFVKYAVMDESLNFSDKGQIPAPLASREAFAEAAGTIYETVKGRVNGVAISMPGIIDTDRGYAHTAGAYRHMVNTDIKALLSDRIDVPISVENDGKAAILAEMWKGSLQGVQNASACIIGSGLGGAVVMDGKLRKGANFASGEISGLLMDAGKMAMENFAATRCGMSAFLMRVADAKGMSHADFEISSYYEEAAAAKKRISGIEVFEWIEQGDEATCRVYQEWLLDLASVLYNLKMTLDPEKIIIGGGVSRSPRFIKDLKEAFQNMLAGIKAMGFPGCELDVCTFTSEANLVGAACSWLEKYKA